MAVYVAWQLSSRGAFGMELVCLSDEQLSATISVQVGLQKAEMIQFPTSVIL